MGYKNENEVYKRVFAHYQELNNRGFEVVCVMLQGSQNYGLEYENSDVDTKAIVLPKFDDFVKNKTPYSETIILDNDEHIDTKDIRIMFEMFKKMNISYIELLYTDYLVVNPKYEWFVNCLIENREKISKINKNQFLRCLSGMSMEKLKALCHPYPSIVEKIKKYGFDGKQLSHCARLNEFIKKYTMGVKLEECYKSDQKEKLINLKKNLTEDGTKLLNVEDAKKMCEQLDLNTKEIKDKNLTETDIIFKEGIEILDELKTNILKQWFKEQLLNEGGN